MRHGSEDLPPRLWQEAPEFITDYAGAEALYVPDHDLNSQSFEASRDDRSRDGILRAHRRNLAEFQTYQTLVERVAKAPAKDPAIDQEFRGLLKGWLFDRIVVIDGYYASGDQIIGRICEETPPGYRNRIMGIQNIKGTGLDFVYRWYAWGTCHDACAQFKSAWPAEAERGLAALARFQEYGLLCEEHVRATAEEVRHNPLLQREHLQAQLSVVLSNLDEAMREVHASLSRVRETGGLRARLIQGIEALLDAGDAVRRRKKANRIYEDLIAERISIDRAILELQGLTKRQKGGWLGEHYRRRVRPSSAAGVGKRRP